MPPANISKWVWLACAFALVWLGMRFLLPLALPFLLGGLLAMAAEPAAAFLCRRLKLPRFLAAGISVTAALGILLCLVVLAVSLAVRELGLLADILPDLGQTVSRGMDSLQSLLLALADRTPDWVAVPLNSSINNFFGSGSVLMERVISRVPAMASSALSHVPGSALTAGTAVISAYMLCARMPRLKAWFAARLRGGLCSWILPAWQRIRSAIGGWLKAQLKLSGVSFCVLLAGFLLLGIRYAPVWALGICLLDALPLLGTGAILLPWALVSLVQGSTAQAVGLAVLYAATALTRSVLEPRLVGRQLGLDPLLTLIALYAGFRLWGLAGMLLAPLIAVSAGELAADGA